MLTIERLCERIIYLTHTPIRVYRQDGSLERVYLDNGEMQDPVACDPQLLAGLLERRRKDFSL